MQHSLALAHPSIGCRHWHIDRHRLLNCLGTEGARPRGCSWTLQPTNVHREPSGGPMSGSLTHAERLLMVHRTENCRQREPISLKSLYATHPPRDSPETRGVESASDTRWAQVASPRPRNGTGLHFPPVPAEQEHAPGFALGIAELREFPIWRLAAILCYKCRLDALRVNCGRAVCTT